MRKDFLEKRLLRLNQRIEELRQKGLASNDVEEVRRINEKIEELREEVAYVQGELDVIEEEEARSAGEPVATGTPIPASAQPVNGSIVGSFEGGAQTQSRSDNPACSMAYREAFRDYVVSGKPVMVNRAGEAISTEDTEPAIPLTIMNRVINTVRKRYGNLYNKVLKTSMRGGVQYSIGALKATFKWINESTVSPRQKTDPLAKITFAYHPAEIRVAQTFLENLLTVDDFETKIAEVIGIAYLEAMDLAIVDGSGDGMPLGILHDARVTHEVEFTAAEFNNWKKWREKFFAKLPLGYRAGEFIFPLSTVEAYLKTMSDANNNPIFSQATGLVVNDGDIVNPNGAFFGRAISLVEPNIIADFDTAQDGDVVGIFWQPEEYVINENFGFTMRRYFDEETNEIVDKALVVVDGKILNPEGFYLIKKKA